MSIKPRALVLEAPGINCNIETASALNQAGAEAEQVHISQLIEGDRSFDDYQIFALSGGFSYGDAVRSGAFLGADLKKYFPEELNRFVEAGKAIIGICNGFQTLVESGLLPDGKISDDPKRISLVHNENNKFECRWTKLMPVGYRSEVIIPDDPRTEVELPVAHGEGRITGEDSTLTDLIANGQVTLMYKPHITSSSPYASARDYPHNPNGSPYGITGICDPTGVVNGMMPHPERFVTETQHPNWRRGEGKNPFGAIIFKNLVDYAKEL